MFIVMCIRGCLKRPAVFFLKFMGVRRRRRRFNLSAALPQNKRQCGHAWYMTILSNRAANFHQIDLIVMNKPKLIGLNGLPMSADSQKKTDYSKVIDLGFGLIVLLVILWTSDLVTTEVDTSFIAPNTKLDASLVHNNPGKVVINPVQIATTLGDHSTAAFIERFKDVAKVEQRKFGIPASITIAQGILESASGTSRLAKEANNYFGVKCFSSSCQRGHCMNASDDSHKDFFRIYPNAWHSFRSHSQLLNKKHYADCHKCTTVECWAQQLQKAGYATSKTYSGDLIKIINKYKLKELDIK